MTSVPKDIREEDLVAYVDGALTADRKEQVEAYLKTAPDAARRVEADKAMVRDLRRAFAGVIAEMPTSVPLAAPRARPVLAWAASVALALIVGAQRVGRCDRHCPPRRNRSVLWPKPSRPIVRLSSRLRIR